VEGNDLGIKGSTFPEWQKAACTFCGVCEAVCPANVVKVDKEKQNLAFKQEGCVYCGKCVKSCPANAWTGKNGYVLSFGGMFGNDIKEGLRLLPIIFEKDQVFEAADAVIKFYQAHGNAGERLGKTISRVGADVLKKDLEEALA
jgi:dissimilatory sulfite reductase (desulfoviridin) alpha/beta subunit